MRGLVDEAELDGGRDDRTRGSYSGLAGIDCVVDTPEANAANRVASCEEGSKEIREAFGPRLISRRGGVSDDFVDCLSAFRGAECERRLECVSELYGTSGMLRLSLSMLEVYWL